MGHGPIIQEYFKGLDATLDLRISKVFDLSELDPSDPKGGRWTYSYVGWHAHGIEPKVSWFDDTGHDESNDQTSGGKRVGRQMGPH